MARLGAFCFPGTGHLNPLTALARRLQQRGHTVIIFGIADVESRVRAAGVDFCLIGQSDYPPGTLQKLDQQLGKMTTMQVLRFTIGAGQKHRSHGAPRRTGGGSRRERGRLVN